MRCEFLSTPCHDSCYDAMPPNIDYVLLKFYSKIINEFHNICGIYVPPSQTLITYQSIFNLLEREISPPNISNTYIFGDFNLPQIDWIVHDTSALVPRVRDVSIPMESLILYFLTTVNCKQYNCTKNHMGRTSDLLGRMCLYDGTHSPSTCRCFSSTFIDCHLF